MLDPTDLWLKWSGKETKIPKWQCVPIKSGSSKLYHSNRTLRRIKPNFVNNFPVRCLGNSSAYNLYPRLLPCLPEFIRWQLDGSALPASWWHQEIKKLSWLQLIVCRVFSFFVSGQSYNCADHILAGFWHLTLDEKKEKKGERDGGREMHHFRGKYYICYFGNRVPCSNQFH